MPKKPSCLTFLPGSVVVADELYDIDDAVFRNRSVQSVLGRFPRLLQSARHE